MNKDYSISMLRCIACLFIFICHAVQYFQHPLTWWFNVSVHVFLILSAILYAQKNIISIPDFLFFRFFRILPAYYVLASCIVLLQAVRLSLPWKSSLISVLFLQGNNIPGLEHLWFIPAILICYFAIPFLQKFCDEIQQKKLSVVWIIPFLLLVVISFFREYAYPIITFISAYMLKRCLPVLFTEKIPHPSRILLKECLF